MGATAIGTGLTASPGYAEKCVAQIAKITGKPFVGPKDLIAATSSMQAFVMFSSAYKNLAVTLSKISSDLIFLTSGPRNGIFEINLPALQPGSSIMPGKVNPVMPELMNQICYKVLGNDVTVGVASRDGLLQLNAYEPVVAVAIMESQALFFKTMPLFRKNCIDGITVNEEVLKRYLETTIGIVTALNPVLGYEKTTELAKEALQSGKGILELIREKKLLTEDQIKKLMDPAALTGQKIMSKSIKRCKGCNYEIIKTYKMDCAAADTALLGVGAKAGTANGHHLLQNVDPGSKARLAEKCKRDCEHELCFRNEFVDGEYTQSRFRNEQFRLEIRGRFMKKYSFRFRDRYTRAKLLSRLIT
jgi:hypothetical protein